MYNRAQGVVASFMCTSMRLGISTWIVMLLLLWKPNVGRRWGCCARLWLPFEDGIGRDLARNSLWTVQCKRIWRHQVGLITACMHAAVALYLRGVVLKKGYLLVVIPCGRQPGNHTLTWLEIRMMKMAENIAGALVWTLGVLNLPVPT